MTEETTTAEGPITFRRNSGESLRQRAEDVVQKRPEEMEEIPAGDIQDLIHELQVHQVELEMQNEELRQARQALERARDRYSDLYEFAPVGYFTLNRKGTILEANLTLATLLGVERAALTEGPLSRFIVSEDQDVYYHHRRRLFETQQPQSCELRMVRGDGSRFWVQIEARAALDSAGQPVCRATISDVTERKRAEEAVLEERVRLGNILAALETGLSLINPDMTIAWVNRKIREMFPGVEPLGQLCHRFYEGRETLCENCGTRPAFQTGEVQTGERWNPLTGRWYAIISQPIKDEQGNVINVLEGVTDITERKQAAEALRRSEERYRQLAESTEAVLWEFDVPSDRWTYVAPQVTRFLGYPPEAWTDLQFWVDHVHPEDRRWARDYCLECVGRGEPHTFEYRFLKKDGGVAWLRDVVSVEMKDGKPVKLRGFMIDITAHKRAEAQLEEYANNLEQMVDEQVQELERERTKIIQMDKLSSLGQLATSIAHELNQPLTAITFDADYLKTLANQTETAAALDLTELMKIGQELEGDVARCRHIIDHLRNFGRVATEDTAPVDLNQPLEDSFILIGAQLRDHHVTVDLRLAEALPYIQANLHKLEQVFLNLIANAEYAMQESAEQDGREKILTLSTRQEGDWVVAEVRDNGCGIPEDVQKRLFEPFFTTKPEGVGTGLGLSICYNIVTDIGGEITCQSTEGEGTTFTLRFPVKTTE